MRRVRSTAWVPLLLALAGFGCGSQESQTPGPPAGAAPQAPAPPAGAPAPEPVAETPEWKGELPRDFPADVPHYPGSKIASARGAEGLGVVVTFDSPDALDVVAKFYADGLAAEGWQAQLQQLPDATLVVADKENRRAHVLVHPGGQGTLVELMIMPVE